MNLEERIAKEMPLRIYWRLEFDHETDFLDDAAAKEFEDALDAEGIKHSREYEPPEHLLSGDRDFTPPYEP